MNHQARRLATKPRLTKETRRRIRAYVAERDGRLCHYCRRPFADLYGVTLDHYVPHCLWAMNRPRNLVLACVACNQGKADSLPVTLAFTLLARAAAAPVFTPLGSVFTVDQQAFIGWARKGVAARGGRPVAAPGGDSFSVAFILAVNVFTDPTGYVGGAMSRVRVGCRATVPLESTSRALTWKSRPISRRMDARLNTVNTKVNTRLNTLSVGLVATGRARLESGRLQGVVNTQLGAVNSLLDTVNTWGVAA